MIVCHCRVVTDRAIGAAVRSGVRSVAGVCSSTGAAQDCGACVFAVKRLVCEHGAAAAPPLSSAAAPVPVLSEVDVAAS